jgi:sec-independent protein translocase protein TatB
MFDISWTEFLLIGVVALVVIGPKELPAVLRTLGQWTRRVRSMAADFQGQFQEALREAEMADLKKQVDDIAHDIKSYDPLKDVRADVEAAGKDIKSSLEQPSSLVQPPPEQPSTADQPWLVEPAPAPALDGPQSLAPDAVATATGPVTPGAVDESAPPLPPPEPDVAMPEGEFVGAGIGPAVPDAAESVQKPDATGHAE